MSKEKNTIASVAWPLGKLYVLVSIKAFSGRALCASALMKMMNGVRDSVWNAVILLFMKRSNSILQLHNGSFRAWIENQCLVYELFFMKVFMQMPTDMQNRSYFLNKFSL